MTNAAYQRLTDYFAQDYPLYERAGIRYPVVLNEPDSSQLNDPDSLLANGVPTAFEDPATFAFRDEMHLESLRQNGRRMENKITFSFHHLETHPLKLHARLGTYFDMLTTCDALDQEMRHYAAHPESTPAALLRRNRLHKLIPPQRALVDGTGRSATLGVATLTVFNHAGTYEAILVRRSQAAAVDPGFYHVLPAFVLQPGGRDVQGTEWSITHHLYRELLEELFGLPEQDQPASPDYFYDHPALVALKALIASGRASLHLTGLVLNLLTLRPEVCAMLLIRDPNWYEQAAHTFQEAWEAEQRSLVFAPISSDDALLSALPAEVRGELYAHMGPQASVALWLGVDRARTLVNQT